MIGPERIKKMLERPDTVPDDLREATDSELRTLFREFNSKVSGWQHPRARMDVGGPARVDTHFQSYSIALQRIQRAIAVRFMEGK